MSGEIQCMKLELRVEFLDWDINLQNTSIVYKNKNKVIGLNEIFTCSSSYSVLGTLYILSFLNTDS